MPLASGAVFAGYTIVRLLTSSTTGEVYLAEHPRLPRRDAVRILSSATTPDVESKEAFRRRTAVLTTLYHPHLAELYASGESDGKLWLATEYIDGISAAQLIQQRFPSGMHTGEALAVITAVATALDYLHQRGLVHHDVQPSSILLAEAAADERRILLTDYGFTWASGGSDSFATANLTPETVAYAAPEQLKGLSTDARSDQYSLAATAFYLLAGVPPFQDANPVGVISAHLTAMPPKLSDRGPRAADIDEVLSKALSKKPDERFGSCAEFADALNQCTGASTAAYSPEAYLAAVDYPDDNRADDALTVTEPERSHHQRLVAAPANRTAAGGSFESGAKISSKRRRAYGLASAAVVCLGMLAVGIVIGRHNNVPPAPHTSPPDDAQASAPPAAAPTVGAPSVPGPSEMLDGSYRIDVNRAKQTYNETPAPQPPNVSTWWAFRAVCTPAGCVATGQLLDDADHQTASTKGGDNTLVLDFRDGSWRSRPQTVEFPCVGPHGTAASQSTTQTISLQRSSARTLRGVMIVSVHSDECSQAGAEIRIPATAERVGDVPAGVTLPDPP